LRVYKEFKQAGSPKPKSARGNSSKQVIGKGKSGKNKRVPV